MITQILIAHAKDEEHFAEQLAGPIQDAGYKVVHYGTVMVGDSFVEEASKALMAGAPVVLCGTIKAVGTRWARRFVNAARQNNRSVEVFVVRMEEEADVEQLTLDGKVAEYWQDSARAMQELISSLKKYYPLDIDIGGINEARHKMQGMINQYMLLTSLNAASSKKNRVMNRMRALAPDVRYSCEKIVDYLQSLDEGERFTALASVQWQWQNQKVHAEMNFSRLKGLREIPPPPDPEYRDTDYFPQLLDLLCDSNDKFENYHATVAMWSMSYSLEPNQIQVLCERVIDKAGYQECPCYYKCDEWDKFIDDLRKRRPSSP